MKNIVIFILLLFSTAGVVASETSARWKPLFQSSEYIWDSESARKVDAETVRFWYESPFLEEQREYLVKSMIYTLAEANTIAYGRVGIVANCKSMQYAIFSAVEMKATKIPLRPGSSLPLNKVQMEFIEPDTIVEGFVIAVCKHLKIK